MWTRIKSGNLEFMILTSMDSVVVLIIGMRRSVSAMLKLDEKTRYKVSI